mgnify:CR=1 FL=1
MTRNFDLIKLSTWSNGVEKHSNVIIYNIDDDKFYLVKTPYAENHILDYYLDAGVSPTIWYRTKVEELWDHKIEISNQEILNHIEPHNPRVKKYLRHIKLNDILDI